MLKLNKNIVRVNGWKDGKRTHVDVEVSTRPNIYRWGIGDTCVSISDARAVTLGFKNGLDAVTSYNYYNYVIGTRMTCRIW